MRKINDFRATVGFQDAKDTMEVLELGFSLQEAIQQAYSDKKITILDAVYLFKPLMVASAALENIQNVKRELTDMTPEGRKIVMDFVNERFTLTNAELEALVKETIAEVMGDVTVAFKWGELRKRRAF